jgi:hypothetical protein
VTGPPAGWDPDLAAARLRAKAQAERRHYAEMFAALHSTDPAEIEREADRTLTEWDERIEAARRPVNKQATKNPQVRPHS